MATPSLASLMRHGFMLTLPPHDAEVLAYVGATNNIATLKGYLGGTSGTLVGTLTFTYAAAGAANDDLTTAIVLTVP